MLSPMKNNEVSRKIDDDISLGMHLDDMLFNGMSYLVVGVQENDIFFISSTGEFFHLQLNVIRSAVMGGVLSVRT